MRHVRAPREYGKSYRASVDLKCIGCYFFLNLACGLFQNQPRFSGGFWGGWGLTVQCDDMPVALED